MALQMTLEAKYNHMNKDFVDAYWAIKNIGYGTDSFSVSLYAYPSREACHSYGRPITDRLCVGASIDSYFNPYIYCWQACGRTSDVFPEGIPIDVDRQKTAIYQWIKDYTQLPFEDVLETE